MFALVDCNNFFVSCERAFDLSLTGQPVAVLSNNDGCVISRSNELKSLGIKMGMPFFQLKPLLERHKILIRSSNFELYGDMSRRVMAILNDFSADVEQYSIDEAFLRFNAAAEQEEYLATARRLRQTILRWLGLPVGIGMAPTKTLAKIASHLAKSSPEGIFLLPHDPTAILTATPVGDVWGIGRHLNEKLQRIGIRTALQLSRYDETILRQKFNVGVARTALELRGISALEQEDMEAPPQSITHSRSFGHPVTELKDLTEAIASYTAQAAVKLRQSSQQAAGINVFFQYYPEYGQLRQEGGFSGTTVMFPTPTDSTTVMLHAIEPTLPGLFLPGRRYKKAGVTFFGLANAAAQQELFAAPESERDQRLYNAIDQINRQLGKRSVFHLAEGMTQPWTMKRDHLSPCYTTRWDQLLQVK